MNADHPHTYTGAARAEALTRWMPPLLKTLIPDVTERLEWLATYHEIKNLPEVPR